MDCSLASKYFSLNKQLFAPSPISLQTRPVQVFHPQIIATTIMIIATLTTIIIAILFYPLIDIIVTS